jgi:hypothetical protein
MKKRTWLMTLGMTVAATRLFAQDAWVEQDVKSVGVAGSSTCDAASGSFTRRGTGHDIGVVADGFHCLYQTVTINVQITARIVSQSNTRAWTLQRPRQSTLAKRISDYLRAGKAAWLRQPRQFWEMTLFVSALKLA